MMVALLLIPLPHWFLWWAGMTALLVGLATSWIGFEVVMLVRNERRTRTRRLLEADPLMRRWKGEPDAS